MSIQIRNTDPAVLGPIAAQINALRTTVAVAGSKYHADVTTRGATTGDFSAPVAGAAALCATTDATNTGTGCALANVLAALLLAHFADALAHKVADTTNDGALATAADLTATDDTTMIALVAAIQTAWNAHDGSTVFHYTADTNDDAGDVDTAAHSRTTLNALKVKYNAHIASAPAGSSIVLDPP